MLKRGEDIFKVIHYSATEGKSIIILGEGKCIMLCYFVLMVFSVEKVYTNYYVRRGDDWFHGTRVSPDCKERL